MEARTPCDVWMSPVAELLVAEQDGHTGHVEPEFAAVKGLIHEFATVCHCSPTANQHRNIAFPGKFSVLVKIRRRAAAAPPGAVGGAQRRRRRR